MQKLVWQNSNNEVIDLTSGNYGITEWEGFSNTDLNIQSQQVPFQDGGVFLDALIEQRELSVTLAMNDGGNLETRYRLRRELIHALNPKLGEGYLIYTNDFISKRIKCVAQIPLFETHNSNDSGTPKASLAWTACEPYWEDLEESAIQFGIGQSATINNNGDIPAQVEIIFNGTSTDSRITNKTTGKFIEYNRQLDSQLKINTNLGNKSVYITTSLNYEAVEWRGNISSVRSISEYGRFFGTTTDGEIISSFDGLDWEVKQVSQKKLYDIAYSKTLGLFVAVGAGNIVTSIDGENWEEEDIGIGSDNNKSRIIWISDLQIFVLISGEYIYTSTDGFAFTQKMFVEDRVLDGVAYSKKLGMIVAVGDIAIVTSTDGETWNTTEISSYGFHDVIYSEQQELFVIVGNDIYKSADGVSWTLASSLQHANFIAYDRTLDLYIAGTDEEIFTSSDLSTWTSRKSTDATYLKCISYNYDLDIICVGGDSGVTFTSSNAQNWQDNITGLGTYTINDVAMNEEGICIAVGAIIARSSDNGQTWTKILTVENWLNGVIYANDEFIAVGYQGLIMTSSDGLQWSSSSSGYTGRLNAITYNSHRGLYVIVGAKSESESGDIITSSDLSTWTRRTIINGAGRLFAIDFSNELYVAVGEGVAISSNGIDWTGVTITGLGEYRFNGVAYNELLGNFVIVGDDQVIGVSSNGTDWTFTETDFLLNSIKYNPIRNQLIAIGGNGVVLVGVDGVAWEEIFITSVELKGQSYNLNDIIFVGNRGTIIKVSMLDSGVQNMIQYINKNSDMGFNLQIGTNKLYLSKTSGNFSAIVKYRQKYIGV